MSTPKLLLSTLLRRRNLLISTSIFSHHPTNTPHFTTATANTTSFCTPNSPYNLSSISSPYYLSSLSSSPYKLSSSRCFLTRGSEFEPAESGFLDELVEDFDGGGAEIAEVVSSGGGGGEDLSLPVRSLISLLDWFHDLSGLPWWIVIATSTLALRVAILPLLLLQLRKLRRISELLPKLPPPIPPPLSGRSYEKQFRLFQDKKKAVGCPSLLWFFPYMSVSIPCFFLGVTTIRRMSLDHHPDFEFGGTLWFQNLTELPHGGLGCIFPLLIAGLHLVNVQISLNKSFLGDLPDTLGLLAKYYRYYLQFLTIPILYAGFCIPQGSLVYWITNSTFTLIQQLVLKDQRVREKLGSPGKNAPTSRVLDSHETVPPSRVLDSQEIGEPIKVTPLSPSRERVEIPLKNLSPLELVNLSVQLLSSGHRKEALELLRRALDKDSEYVRALILMGQTLVQDQQLAEAAGYLECAVAKLLSGNQVEDVNLLIVASQWAGVAYVRQGKTADGIVHLERIANMKEPEDMKIKAHYCDGLLILSSTLLNEGRNAEASKYVRILASIDPAYNKYLKDCEDEEDNFVDDLVNSRRKDY